MSVRFIRGRDRFRIVFFVSVATGILAMLLPVIDPPAHAGEPPAPTTTQPGSATTRSAQATAPRLDAKWMLRGYFYAGSKVPDKEALGGFGLSDNLPRTINSTVPPRRRGLFLHVDLETPVRFADRYEGVRVLLVNATGRERWLRASDSRLSIVQEALDADGKWKPIEYLPSSSCGNSYHRVYLGPREFWSFTAPRYDGPVKTKLRFKLLSPDAKDAKDAEIISNEFEGGINVEQFRVKQGHTPTNIMDPYVE